MNQFARFGWLMVSMLVLVACDQKRAFDHEGAISWSQRNGTKSRANAATFSRQLNNGRWVFVTTAKMEETDGGLMYAQGEILPSGFLVYPGGEYAATIEEAIKLCEQSEGAEYPGNSGG